MSEEAIEEGEIVVPDAEVRVLDTRSSGAALERSGRSQASLPVVQAAAAAAGGFVAGAAVVGLVGRRHRRALAAGRGARKLARRSSGRGSMPAELLQIVGSRSLLLDVHLLGGPGER